MQQYKNHLRFYAPHHFIFYPVALVLLGTGTYGLLQHPERRLEWGMIIAALILVIWVAVMLRQHYALGNQNRIVRLELRLRYYQLTGQRLEPLEQQLSFGQLAALRFAGDEELLPLLERTLRENLSPDAIKRSIKVWVPDEMRV